MATAGDSHTSMDAEAEAAGFHADDLLGSKRRRPAGSGRRRSVSRCMHSDLSRSL